MSRPLCAIVGAGEGLGAALAAKFAAEGCDLALLGRTEAGSGAAFEAARAAGRHVNIQYYGADATRPESIEQAFAAVGDEMGNVEILIYNVRAAFPAFEPLEIDFETLEDNFRLEVTGALAAAQSVLPAMRARGHGTLMFSSATAAFRGSAKYPIYAIGKFGLRALVQSLAKAYAGDGIHAVHMRLDCDLDVPIMRELYGEQYRPGMLADPADVAESYWWVHRQPRGAWSNEVELRPHTETWTY